jgi:hypothetical protein
MILIHSMEPNLIHACRQLRDTLPSFVQWTKSIAFIALCMIEVIPQYRSAYAYAAFRQLIQHYETDCGITPLTASRRRAIRVEVYTSSWFKLLHFHAMMSELDHAMTGERDPQHLGVGWQLGRSLPKVSFRRIQLGRDGDMSIIKEGELRIARMRDFRSNQVKLSIWISSEDCVKPTAIVERFGARDGEKGVVDRVLWSVTMTGQSAESVESLQEAMVCRILQNDAELLQSILPRLRGADDSDPLGGVEWKHVALAAELGHIGVLDLLLHRPVWPAWEPAKLIQLADSIRNSKTKAWATICQRLYYDWRMQRSQKQYHIQGRLAEERSLGDKSRE